MAFTIDPVIVKVAVGAVLLLALYMAWLKWQQPKLNRTVAAHRGKPLVITKVGLATPERTVELADHKYMVFYDHPTGYRETYYHGQDVDGLVPVDVKHNKFGGGRPVYIELDVLVELAYGYEHVPTRKLLKKTLAKVSDQLEKGGLTEAQMAATVKKLIDISERLNAPPPIVNQVMKQLYEETDKAGRYESKFRAAESGVEGTINRRTEPMERIATARAKQPRRPGSEDNG